MKEPLEEVCVYQKKRWNIEEWLEVSLRKDSEESQKVFMLATADKRQPVNSPATWRFVDSIA